MNPVLLLPQALAARSSDLAKGFIGSLTLGAGQFCTNPGLIIGLDSPELDQFIQVASEALSGAPAAVMLTPGIHKAYEAGVATLKARDGVTERGCGLPGAGVNQGSGALFETSSAAFLADPVLAHEIFGSASVVVRCADAAALVQVLEALEGQLTATLHMDEGDLALAQSLVPVLERKVGRILVNGWPTGVEVSHAMVHGGPYPATSDARTTSVGTLAIARFLRPVCYQSFPDALLPASLQAANPLGLIRQIDGQVTVPVR